MSAIGAIILDVAAGLGVPYIKKILTDLTGAGPIAGEVIDAIAKEAGVTPAEIPTIAKEAPGTLESAIVKAEPAAAELWISYVESQRLMGETIALDYEKEPWWAWAWRPLWMWLLGFLWGYVFVAQPILKAALLKDLQTVDVTLLMTVTGIFVTFYMGGHTAKDWFTKWRETRGGLG
ncbi:hypothetical protein EHS39_09020 [Ensifer sp. MPMI2T]|nr:hypothetical protein EHS39_09020 [Ensifer sp. MPMI2T]